jgi:hypothetical protein
MRASAEPAIRPLEDAAGEPPPPRSPGKTKRRARGAGAGWRPSWARALLAVVVVGPPLAIGGVPAWTLPAFLVALSLLWLRVCARAKEGVRVPWGALIGAAAAALTLAQWLPSPLALRELLAPSLTGSIAAALAGAGVEPWPSLSPVPADTAFESARLLGLTTLFVAAAQLSWRSSAALVAAAGAAVAVVGLVQRTLGMTTIWGVYRPQDVDPGGSAALLTTFVNPNHQADLFLLTCFAGAGLALHHRACARESAEGKHQERALMAAGAAMVAGAALILSLSRGALVAFVLALPLALALAWSSREQRRSRRRGRWRGRLIGVGIFGGVAAVIAARGRALDEVRTLMSPEVGVGGKVQAIAQAMELHALSPALGVGRGAFLDLAPALGGGAVIHTHIESAPVALWVEWGWFGAALGAGLAIWWLMALRQGRALGRTGAREIALCGPLAVALHSLGDFSLEFLGVAAPLCALCGGLAPGDRLRLSARAAGLGGVALLAAAAAVATAAAPYTWTLRAQVDAAIAEGVDPGPALRARPLDAGLHRALAKVAGARGEASLARAHAEVAATRAPSEPEGWLLVAAAAATQGDRRAVEVALRRSLAALRAPPSPQLSRYVLALAGSPEALGALMPGEPAAWARVIDGLSVVDPAAALEVAIGRPSEPVSSDIPVIERQAAAALLAESPALAIHYARLLVRADPARAGSTLLLVRALRTSAHPREQEVEAALEAALAQAALRDPAERALLEEALIAGWIASGDPARLARARALLPALQARPGDRAALRRRHALARALPAP